ncbi:3-oxoacyl-[acyl-carrier-protein] synthase III C-terminal domain-containing protein [Pararobbsia silviterrae]|uniref:3-oxoacyl-ACP reductase n=1 Tax=Pararobbsia silviterrae TaxID=1792498 RepID=A0A494XZJ4_9BURK|nr:3-oxoacyl-[acyl-carrier-protein] synthase III C-terminal domain-containing protein [Pararobbsia silviterrae]RKP53606.1 3-oxoacyl-ACP reductase [Pararobbsia silviterrae]
MKIAGIKAAVPSRTVTNRHIEDMVCEHSPELDERALRDALRRIGFFLTYSGSKARRWLADGETPFGLLSQAVGEAIADAQLRRAEIDLIVYTGVDRGFLEPAMAYLIGASLGMPQAHCFDIVDACMSWTRAAFIVSSLLSSGAYRNALIVNCEFNMRADGRVNPRCFRLEQVDAVEWNLAAYTLGEAASATVLVRDDAQPWEFHFGSEAQYSDLCSVPLDAWTAYCEPQPRLGCNGPNHFHSFASEMFRVGKPHAIEVFNRLSVPHESLKAIFPHAASMQAWWEMGTKLGVQDKIQFIYPDLGNIVSASVPVALARARDTGTVREGDRIAGWVGSAGMSFASFASQL